MTNRAPLPRPSRISVQTGMGEAADRLKWLARDPGPYHDVRTMSDGLHWELNEIVLVLRWLDWGAA